MLRNEVHVVFDGELFQVGFYTDHAMIDFWCGAEINWSCIHAFLKTGVLPG